MHDILTPPVYCPDAIATDVGWINPKNGELLIAVRNLRQRIAEQALAVEHKREDVKPEAEIVDVQQPVDDRSDTQNAFVAVPEQVEEIQAESVTITKENNNITIGIKESTEVAEAVNKPKRPGRPKKQANEQSK